MTDAKLSQEQKDAMLNLKDYADRSFRSKRVLKLMSKLYEQGLIEFNPFTAHACLTDKGKKILEAA